MTKSTITIDSPMELEIREKPSKEEQAESAAFAKERQADIDAGSKNLEKRHKALDFLLKKSTIYSNIMLKQIQANDQAEEEEEEKAKTASEASEKTEKRGRGRAKKSSDKTKLSSYFTKSEVESKAEENALDESIRTDGIGIDNLKASRQPKLVTGGVMRKYQLEGLEWLKSLYENGINGILADEMGLGKTIQTISLLAFIREMGVYGPFVIVAPLSTLTNWVDEFNKWAPSLPVILYHGTPDERTDIRSAEFKDAKSPKFPIIVTSYEMLMRDQKHFTKYTWEFIIIDEGHRIKNVQSLLIKKLMELPSHNRLLLTGTPLQNNLSELWSLLHFLMPSVFNDYENFESWFDFSALKDKDQYDQIFDEEREKGLITTLHSILKPFLLRRVKADVEKLMPKKREYVLFAPLTQLQHDIYQSILDGKSRAFLEEKVVELQVGGRASSPASNTPSTGSKRKRGRVSEQNGPAKTPKSTRDSTPVSTASRRRAKNRQLNYTEMSDSAYFAMMDRSPPPEEDESSDSDASTKSMSAILKFAKKQIAPKKLQNPSMQLRLCCNSPYSFYDPYVRHDGTVLEPDEDLVKSSGKMMVLDLLLKRLFEENHKVLIFSQFKIQLDLIETFTDMRGWQSCRIDGSISQTERAEQIRAFNDSEGPHNLFLLSTRAGGVGINLTAADTVILFDSDWNPQQDLQAQDRAHRIGQKNNVLVYRFATRGTIEEQLLEKAQYKRRLEKLSIQKGGLRGQTKEKGEAAQMEELRKMLAQVDGQAIDLKDGAILSKEDLAILTDRSPEAYERAEKGEDKSTAFQSLDMAGGLDEVFNT